MIKPLENILVIDLSQFLSGPSATLRLADFGARVIKIEKPTDGDLCRRLYLSDTYIDGESTLFHAINRNKESIVLDLKKIEGENKLKQLILKADVFVHNFRPDAVKRLGITYQNISKMNPKIIYAEINGYGKKGPWKSHPGQDLLLQSITGLTWLSGNKNDGPVPMGIAIADILAGTHLAQGILTGLLQQSIHHKGCHIEVSMLESCIDFQFEMLTTFFKDEGKSTHRSEQNNAHAYLGAPYGVFKTSNGYLALAMANISQLGGLFVCDDLKCWKNPQLWYPKRDKIKAIIAKILLQDTTEYWLSILEPADIWCAGIKSWQDLINCKGFQSLHMFQEVQRSSGVSYQTTRCPIRFDGNYLTNKKGSPKLNEHANTFE